MQKQSKINNIQGRESPSPGETPYMCRQRNSLARSSVIINGPEQQEVNEMERGYLLPQIRPSVPPEPQA